MSTAKQVLRLSMCLIWLGSSVTSATDRPPSPDETSPSTDQAAKDQESESGYADSKGFGGPSSVEEQLKEDHREKTPFLRFPGIDEALGPWSTWKGGLAEEHGFKVGADYTALVLGTTDSLGVGNATSGMVRLFGAWTLFNRPEGSNGALIYKVEHRHRLSADITPSQLGFESGYLGLVGPQFNNKGLMLTNLHWRHSFRNGRFNYLAGWVDATDYFNVFALVNPWTHYSNLAFSTGTTIPVPDQGLGAAFGLMATDNIYIVGGLADTNGLPTDPGKGFDSFFGDNEYFKHVEIGWVSSYDRRYFDNVHLSAWHADQRVEAGIPDGWGLAFSASKYVADKWLPFLRAEWSEGDLALMDSAISVGIGRYFKDEGDVLGIAFNHASPADDSLGDQQALEVFYRFQISKTIALTPNIQMIFNPALNSERGSQPVFGLRARFDL